MSGSPRPYDRPAGASFFGQNLRSYRQRFVLLCIGLTLAGLILGISQSWWQEFAAPGSLTLSHAKILQPTAGQPASTNRCGTCHEAGQTGLASWTADALFVGGKQNTSQSQLCLKCHERSLGTEHAMFAHGLPTAELQKLTQAQQSSDNLENSPSVAQLASHILTVPQNAQGELACAACHREHHGAKFDLRALTNQQCQVCHTRQFASFAVGHPEFNPTKRERESHIYFDHRTHESKHFTAAKQAFRCGVCHLDDARGEVKLTANFSTACASCHAAKILTSGSDGVALLTLPSIDQEAIEQGGHKVVPMPAGLTADFDGTLPPLMRLLLASDPAAASALTTLGKSGDFSRLDRNQPAHVAAAATLATASQELLAELASAGQPAMQRRLSKVLGADFTLAEIQKLSGQFSSESAQTAQQAWQAEATNEATTDSAKPAGWFVDGATHSIAYRPSGHADPVLTAWLELALATSGGKSAELDDLRQSLTKPNAIGRCLECHHSGPAPLAKGPVSPIAKFIWTYQPRNPAQKEFTRFFHRPHLTQPALQDCKGCHELDRQATSIPKSAESPPSVAHFPRHDFLPRTKAACASCHTPTAAGDSCLKCHNYHLSPQSLGK